MGGFLFLGFLVGMHHALEADHLAAVGAMAASQPGSRKQLALRGAAWGLGHTLTLLGISAAVILLGFTLTGRTAATLEFAVGVMLVLLGADVLRRMAKQRVRFPLHSHDDGHNHIHAAALPPDAKDMTHHAHGNGLPKRAVLVGLMHGAAGSAGLLALAVAATKSATTAMAYVAVFGIGSILGMALLSYTVAWPLTAVQQRITWVWRGLSVAAGIVAITVGVGIMTETWAAMTGSV